MDYWHQPAFLGFYDTTFKDGFHIGQQLDYQFGKEAYTQRLKYALFVGYDYKTNGYLPGYLETRSSVKLNAGLKITF